MRTRFFHVLYGSAVALSLVSGCKKKSSDIPRAPVAAAPAAPAPTPVTEVEKEKPVYVYSGDRFRDPFLPSGQSANYQPDAVFDPQRAIVKGIIFGRGHKSAVVSVGGSGTYFVNDERIFDIMGKTVEGYSAKVFVDKVVIHGEADSVYELKINSSEEEEKT